MSLILEALRKLEREKRAPERGLLVVAATPWPAQRRRWTVAALGLGVAGAALATGVAMRFWPGRAAAPRAVAPTAAGALHTAPPEPPRTGLGPDVSAHRPPRPQSTEGATGIAPSAPIGAAPDREANAAEKTPDAPAAPAAEPEPELQLHAIGARDGQPVAILNDRLVHEGDTFDGVRVLRIGTAEVEVEIGGRRRVLKF